MWNTIKTNLVLPALGRFGTSAATYLVGMDIAETHAVQITTGISALILVGLDLVASWAMRQMAERKAERHVEIVRDAAKAALRDDLKNQVYTGIGGGQ